MISPFDENVVQAHAKQGFYTSWVTGDRCYEVCCLEHRLPIAEFKQFEQAHRYIMNGVASCIEHAEKQRLARRFCHLLMLIKYGRRKQ